MDSHGPGGTVFHLIPMRLEGEGIPPSLRSLLEDETIVKRICGIGREQRHHGGVAVFEWGRGAN